MRAIAAVLVLAACSRAPLLPVRFEVAPVRAAVRTADFRQVRLTLEVPPMRGAASAVEYELWDADRCLQAGVEPVQQTLSEREPTTLTIGLPWAGVPLASVRGDLVVRHNGSDERRPFSGRLSPADAGAP
ncbi:MAG: hypothetical protein K1X89_15045 [Myxococcaceae bacterium]|nr:hypothetical protein [Myxococcaceae bacterium]